MKVLIVLGGFYPAQTYGGPTVSIDNLCTLLNSEVDFYILASDHELNQKERIKGIAEGWNRRHNCNVLYLHSEENSLKQYQNVVNTIKPDIIYINSLFSADKTIPFIRIAYKSNTPLLLAPRGELCINAFNKKYKKLPYIWLLLKYLHASNVWYQSTSDEETAQIIRIIGVPKERILELTNVSITPPIDGIRIKKEIGKCSLVFISRIQSKKNLLFALDILSYVKSDVTFDIFGTKEELDYWTKCEERIRDLPSNIHVKYNRALKHDEVGNVFSQYHGFLFPTLSENYGHVIVESMTSGCPVIMSDQVPWVDVNEQKASWAIPLADKERYIQAVEDLANMSEDQFITLSKNCIDYMKNKTDFERIKNMYLMAFQRMREGTNHEG